MRRVLSGLVPGPWRNLQFRPRAYVMPYCVVLLNSKSMLVKIRQFQEAGATRLQKQKQLDCLALMDL